MAALPGDEVRSSPETTVLGTENRGYSTIAARSFTKGEIIFQEPPLAMVYPSRDCPWLAAMRAALVTLSPACGWQYCVAVHCLLEAELPSPAPADLRPIAAEARARLLELCGAEADADGALEPSELATLTAEHLFRAAEAEAEAHRCRSPERPRPVLWPVAGGERVDGSAAQTAAARQIADTLDDLAVRVSRNGFQVMDLKARPPTSADGLFHRISFFNHCCAGGNNASWVWDGGTGLNTVRTTCNVEEGDELTISYIAKPWCDLAKPARRRYLKQNFNFVCLCRVCMQPASAESVCQGVADGSGARSAGSGKLGDMLVRWMKDEREEQEVGEEEEQREPKVAEAKKPILTDEDRVERVLQRCSGESLDVSFAEAQAALQEEDGHVGKAMIRLRKQKREAGVAADAGS